MSAFLVLDNLWFLVAILVGGFLASFGFLIVLDFFVSTTGDALTL